jgi:5-methylcytosine-specific restriction endonuclease McrA
MPLGKISWNKGKQLSQTTKDKMRAAHALTKHKRDKSFYKDIEYLKHQRESQLLYYATHPEKNAAIRKRMTGTNNHRWRGGITSERMRIYNSQEWKEWRREIFVRDNWTCKKCGARSSKQQYVRIEAHHIKPFALYPDFRFDINNGITLCKVCHSKEPKGREIKI